MAKQRIELARSEDGRETIFTVINGTAEQWTPPTNGK
jgi:hypothetical protein